MLPSPQFSAFFSRNQLQPVLMLHNFQVNLRLTSYPNCAMRVPPAQVQHLLSACVNAHKPKLPAFKQANWHLGPCDQSGLLLRAKLDIDACSACSQNNTSVYMHSLHQLMIRDARHEQNMTSFLLFITPTPKTSN